MLLEHMLATVLNMVNRYKYLPELIIVHVGALDFSRVTNHLDQHLEHGTKLQENHHSGMQKY